MGNNIITETSPEFNVCKEHIIRQIKARTHVRYEMTGKHVVFRIPGATNTYFDKTVKIPCDLLIKQVINWIKSAENTEKIKITMSEHWDDTCYCLYICQIISPPSP